MATRKVTILFRDGSKKDYPDPNSAAIGKRYAVRYGEGIVTIIDQYNYQITYPLDLISSIIEEPEPRW